MKLQKYSTFIAAFVALTITLLSISAAQAEDYFYRILPPLPVVTCSLFNGNPSLSAGSVNIESNVPAGTTVNVYILINDTTTLGGSFSPPSGASTALIAGFFRSDSSYPITYGVRYDALVNGHVFYRSTIVLHCDDIGVGTAEITSGAVTQNGGRIDDGRINPQNYAPVALYCDGSVLTAYKIDSTGGTFAWSFDLSKPTDNPLIDQMGSALSKTGDGRYSVLASQPDGKAYLFVFDSCPAPGTTETYVSDPATGQLVRTE